MTSFNTLFQRFLDRTGDFTDEKIKSDELSDLRGILNTRLREALFAWQWPYRRKLYSTQTISDGDLKFILFPEGEILGVFIDEPLENYCGSVLKQCTAVNDKLYLPSDSGDEIWLLLNPPAPDFLAENAPEFRDEISDAVIELALADYLEQNGADDKAAVRLRRGNALLDREMVKYLTLSDNNVGITRP